MADNEQKIGGDGNIQSFTKININGQVTLIMPKDDENIINFPGVVVRAENPRKDFKKTLITFIDSKLEEIGRSREWLKVMVYRECGIVYQKLDSQSVTRLTEISEYIDSFYIEDE